MGFYIDIVLCNSKTGERKTIETWCANSYSDAWRGAMERGLTELNNIWSPEGDEKYWYLESLTDAVRR